MKAKKEKIIEIKLRKDYSLVIPRKKREQERIVKKLPESLVDIMEETKKLFAGEPPETHSEMEYARDEAKWYWKMLERYPQLKKLGFKEKDVYDPTEKF